MESLSIRVPLALIPMGASRNAGCGELPLIWTPHIARYKWDHRNTVAPLRFRKYGSSSDATSRLRRSVATIAPRGRAPLMGACGELIANAAIYPAVSKQDDYGRDGRA